MPDSVSAPLRAFLQERLASFEQIEIVVLLFGDPARSWTAPEVAAALGMAPEPAAMRLFLLASSGLIAFEPTGVPRYRYVAADEPTAALVGELAGVYRSNRAAIAALTGAPPADPIRSFADAFKLKK